MSELCRELFEKWFKTTEAYKTIEDQNYFKLDLFFFVSGRNQYRHSGVQVAFMTWNAQQKKINQLKEGILELKKIQKTLYALVDQDTKVINELYIKKNELKGRIDSCKSLLKEWKNKGMKGSSDYAIGRLHQRHDCEDELEKALHESPDLETAQVERRVKVDFISESRTEFSNKRFTGVGVLDLVDDRYAYGRLDSGAPFMCGHSDYEVLL